MKSLYDQCHVDGASKSLKISATEIMQYLGQKGPLPTDELEGFFARQARPGGAVV